MMNRNKVKIKFIAFIALVSSTACSQNNSNRGSIYQINLADRLDSVLIKDQRYRQDLFDIEGKYGIKSKERKDLISLLKKQDSINLDIVTSILDRYGWLGVDEVGASGNSCLFLVIQHSDLTTQEKYLPMMREAVKSGKASSSDLAYLEDRIAIRNKKKQIYGSQLYRNDSGIFYFAPIEDERNVNKRRKAVGLGSIEDRAREFGFEYKAPKIDSQ